MTEPIIPDISSALAERLQPTITMWNRLEGRPRTHDFERTLRATVHDPLWMITRQWQVGEFKGEDAGSPVFAKVSVDNRRLDAFQPGAAAAESFEWNVPLEAQVERRSVSFSREGHYLALDIRLLMGRQWLRMVGGIGNHRAEFIARYPIELPDPMNPASAPVCADTDAWQHVAAVAQRAMDGYELYEHILSGGAAHDGTTIPTAQHSNVADIATRFVSWFERMFYQPGEDKAWRPEYLDYQFAISADDSSGRGVLEAGSYHHGQLDWYSVDIDPERASLGAFAADTPPGTAPRPVSSFIPAQLIFEGMPNSRWWSFEDRRTNLGSVKPGTKDLAKLILLDFALIQGNDWFLFPLTLPVGSTTRIRGLAVTNVFGERTWIEAAGRGPDDDWQRWNMYTLSVAGNGDSVADMRFVLLPTVPKIQLGEPIEEVALIRDEIANMVWGIETRVPLPHGRSRLGHEAATDTRHFYQRLADAVPAPEPPPAAAPVQYEVMSNNVPFNWIPFVPVRVPGDIRSIQLQRAALPRIIERDPNDPVKIRPRTGILSVGRDFDEAYFIHEEEVPGVGVRVTQRFQRTRWMGGRVVTWLGVEKQAGHGEGASHLRFDYLAPARTL